MAEVLVIGNGGREAALEQAMIASEEVDRVVVSADLDTGLEQFSGTEKPFVVIGPELPLVDGMADHLRGDGYTVFGASKEAARYEASKSYTVKVMRQAGVLHPSTFIANNLGAAEGYVYAHRADKYVIKADGLAGGKGVVLPRTSRQAQDVVSGMMQEGSFDGAGKEIVNFADRHSGPEVSAMVVVGDNDEFTILPIAQDHKRLKDGDQGPNTGGMGAYAPVPESILSSEQYGQLEESVAKTLRGMRYAQNPFERGLLYGGFMLSEQEGGRPTVIEYNVRFGDPETQVILPLMRQAGVDVYRLLRSSAEGSLEAPTIDMSKLTLSALSVCLASRGYPESKEVGQPIWGLDTIHHNVDKQLAAVKDDKTNGGRVLYVTSVDETLDIAAQNVYDAIDLELAGEASGKIGFDGMQLRHDIGYQARTK